MEGLVVTIGLYICFALIIVGAVLAFPRTPKVTMRHWAGVLPGDTIVVHGEERRIVEVDFDHDAVKLDRPFDWNPTPGDWAVVRHPS
jgi:hypothetical protein